MNRLAFTMLGAVVITIVAESLILGSTVAQRSIPNVVFEPMSECDTSSTAGFFDQVAGAIAHAACWLKVGSLNTWKAFQLSYGVMAFIFNLATFDFCASDGTACAPYYVRVIATTLILGTLLVTAITLLIGGRGQA